MEGPCVVSCGVQGANAVSIALTCGAAGHILARSRVPTFDPGHAITGQTQEEAALTLVEALRLLEASGDDTDRLAVLDDGHGRDRETSIRFPVVHQQNGHRQIYAGWKEMPKCADKKNRAGEITSPIAQFCFI